MSDYLRFKRQLSHSAKGTTWDEHQYVKVEDGKYYYPEGYDKGRTIGGSSDNDASSTEKKDWEKTLMPSMDDLFKKEPGLLDKSKYPSEEAWGNAVVAKIGSILQANKDLFDPNKYTPQEINEMREKTKQHFAEILKNGVSESSTKTTSKKKEEKEETPKKEAKTETKTTNDDEEKKKRMNQIYKTYNKRRQ